jgi:hypothetical protein
VGAVPWVADLVEFSGGHVEDEAPGPVLVHDEGIGLDPRDRLADVRVEVAECLRRPGWTEAGVLLRRVLEPVVGEVGMPQSVWWVRTISSVPSRSWLMASERI